MTNVTQAAAFGKNFRRLMDKYIKENSESFLREHTGEARLTHENFAYYVLGIDSRTLGYYLSGKRIPAWDKLKLIAEVFNATSDDLLF